MKVVIEIVEKPAPIVQRKSFGDYWNEKEKRRIRKEVANGKDVKPR